jgi:sulfur-carrier protein adenylyltransferase/sulfurtransferase
VQIWRGQYFCAVGETEESVLGWLRNRYGDQKQFDVTESCCLLWMNQVLLPSEYPRRSSDVRELAKSSGALELLQESAGKERRHIPVVLGSSSSNGPCFAAVTITSVQKTGIPGFRPGHAPSKILADRVLGSSASVNRAAVARADASWIHGRDQDARQSVRASRQIAIVGCGAIGGPVAVALAMAGAGHLMLPHARFKSRTEELRVVLEKEEDLLLNCDLVVCATGVWSVESALNAWHVSTKHPAQILYAWAEPHACAGHAVAILPDEACLQCQFAQSGEAKKIVTDWKGRSEQHEPACGAVYQRYGPIELSWVTALGTGLALDCLLGNIKASTHRIWASPKALLDAAGGSWNTDWIGENKARESGGFLEERRWERDSHCAICG